MSSPLAVVIPAYRPSARLAGLVRALAERQFALIVIVDDGSGPEFAAILAEAARFPNVRLLRHAVSLGKGAALKTGFNHVLCEMPEIEGVVTADADGGDAPEDIASVAGLLAARPDALVLGARASGGNVPLGRRFGNALTRGALDALLGRRLADPQSGLRGIPAGLLPRLLRIESAGCEFELEMLLVAHRLSIAVLEQPVAAACEPENQPRRLAAPVVAAKLALGTFLFLLNFAVERLLIFRAREEGAGPPARQPRAPLHPAAVALGIAFLALLGLEIHGFLTAHLFAQQIWYPEGIRRFERYAEVYTAVAAILLLAAPRFLGAFFAVLAVVLTAVSVGPVALLATALFLVSASVLGSRLLPAKQASAEHQICATLLGTAVYIFLMTFLARLPVNYAAVWGAVLALPILLDPAGVRRLGAALVRGVRTTTWRRMDSAGLALLVFVLGAQWFAALTPETSGDGLAMHLAIALDMASHHALTFQPARFVWAVMPMGADFAYSIVCILGGEYAAHLLDFCMLLAVVALLYGAARRWLAPGLACLVAASFAATPIVQLVTGSLFVENLLAALVLGMMAAIWRFGESGARRYLFAAMALGGAAMSVKFGALAFTALAVPLAFAEARRHWKALGPRPLATCLAAAALLLTAGLPPYLIAYAKTGNPLFPFLNQTFHSPLLPPGTDLRDARYRTPLNLRLPYGMTFESQHYYEGQNGSLGFQYLVLAPLGIAGLAFARRRVAAGSAWVAVGAILLVMKSEPNARYCYAAIPLALVPAAALLGWLAARRQFWLHHALVLFLVAATALDAYFLPSASYYHKDFCPQAPFSRAGRDRYLLAAAPVRKLIAWFDREHAGAAVLFTHGAEIAGAEGQVYENHWHQMRTLLRIREAGTLPAMLALMKAWNIRYFISRKPAPGELAQPAALAELLARCTQPEYEFGEMYLARLDAGCGATPLTEPSIVVPPGFYDDYDPALLFRGEWHREAGVHGAARETFSHAESPGAEVSIAFQGKMLYWVYTVGPDYGMAAVTIDGRPQAPVDLYWRELDWQHRSVFCCFQPGRHVAVIRLSGRRNPASTGDEVDVDNFEVQ